MVCSFYRLSLPCTTAIVFLAYISIEGNNNIVNIKATTCNCIVVAHLTKLAISTFLGKIEGNLSSSISVLLTIFPRKFHNFVIFRPILMKFSLKG